MLVTLDLLTRAHVLRVYVIQPRGSGTEVPAGEICHLRVVGTVMIAHPTSDRAALGRHGYMVQDLPFVLSTVKRVDMELPFATELVFGCRRDSLFSVGW